MKERPYITENTLPSIQINTERVFGSAKAQCKKILVGMSKTSEDKANLISDDDSEEDIKFPIHDSQPPPVEQSDILSTGQDDEYSHDDISALSTVSYENEGTETITVDHNSVSVSVDNECQGDDEQKNKEDLLVNFD